MMARHHKEMAIAGKKFIESVKVAKDLHLRLDFLVMLRSIQASLSVQTTLTGKKGKICKRRHWRCTPATAPKAVPAPQAQGKELVLHLMNAKTAARASRKPSVRSLRKCRTTPSLQEAWRHYDIGSVQEG